jgi:hypothetical protein
MNLGKGNMPYASIYRLDNAGSLWTFAFPYYWRPSTVEEIEGYCRERRAVATFPYKVNGHRLPALREVFAA